MEYSDVANLDFSRDEVIVVVFGENVLGERSDLVNFDADLPASSGGR